MRIAVTGGTGFVGSHLLDAALAAGHAVQALARQPQPARAGVTWVAGDLADAGALDRLAAGCDAAVHVAGVINGSAEAFARGNVAGTEAMVAAAVRAGVPRLVHISSLAAREPRLSAYGRSKLQSEEPVRGGALAWTILRPPAIYGPRDRELLELFRLARRHVVPLPPRGRLSVIAAADLARLILACLHDARAIGRTFEPDDGRPGGWAMGDFARAVGAAVGTRVVPLPIPKAALLAGAALDRLVRGERAKLTRDRVNYFCHPDWAASAAALPPPELWRAEIATEAGLAETAHWYRAEGWL